MAAHALRLVMWALPLLFAFGFLAPVMAQAMQAMAWEAPMGMTQLQFALVIAGVWGLIATMGGRWI